MMTADRITLDQLLSGGSEQEIAAIAACIEKGSVFIYPTETIYGIGGRADDQSVFRRLLSIKRRPPENPMILLCTDRAAIAAMDLMMPPVAVRCADRFWPGPMTMVLPRASQPGAVAVRVTDHPFMLALARHFHLPIFSTSANISATPYDPDPDAIYHRFCSEVDFMIDAGVLPPSPPSTVVRVDQDDTVTVLREGAVPAADIFSVVNR